ncbi:hypothetical protein OIDMADRAFT_58114 [Oidiodendron maius Zn]|uniref:Glycoside hydrolase family 16 protein n=1 Tax=Oidiodendron maius (strain Zn) TaxID=913774 RepID=A0A0C3H4W3_OIDMZ|nr:hypothetical protein OIDMADRAFT_58114 [Oidiodendron maius Zn]
MFSSYSLALLLLSALAQAQGTTQLVLDFDDIDVSNEQSCGTAKPDVYKGVSITSVTPDSIVLNTTQTAECASSANEAGQASPFGFASSPPNVLYSDTGDFFFQILTDSTFINGTSFTIGLNLSENQLAEAAAGNLVITIQALISDFGNFDFTQTYNFDPATDGLGPYALTVDNANNTPYLFLEVTAEALTQKPFSAQFVPAIIDSIVFETLP